MVDGRDEVNGVEESMDNVQTTKSDLKVALWIFRYFYYENGCLNSSLFGCIYLWSRTDSCSSYYKFSYFAISQAISVCLIIFWFIGHLHV
jgi:hypothetical protein